MSFDLSQSPIRRNINELDENQMSIFESDDLINHNQEDVFKYRTRTILKDIEDILNTMENNKESKLKIVILGEVKAGKSTFVNACIGKEVAYTDILEATAIVSEITYSENEYTHIIDINNSVCHEFSFSELLKWMETKLENEEDFSNLSRIEIGVNSKMLNNFILVDTPGLLSITSENHDVTNKYISQTDYAVWVINSRNLGSKAVNDYIEKVKLSGKPLIGVLNKVDTIEQKEEICEYIEKEYKGIFEKIFYVSSKSAWNAICNEQKAIYEKSGISEVLEYLEDLSDDKEYSKSSSNNNTLFYQLKRELEIHIIIRTRICARKEFYDNDIATFSKINTEIKKAIYNELEHWIQNELYLDERTVLMNTTGDEFMVNFNKFREAAYLNEIVECKSHEIEQFIYKKWNVIMSMLIDNSSQVLIDFKYDKDIDETIISDIALKKEGNASNGIIEGMKKGAMIGIAFAGYSAWLGPAAAYITFGSALFPAIIPLAIGGAIWGTLFKPNSESLEEIETNAKKKNEIVENLYHEVVQATRNEMRIRIKEMYKCTEYYFIERCNKNKENVNKLNFDFSEPTYTEFMKELDEYINRVKEQIAIISGDEVVATDINDYIIKD